MDSKGVGRDHAEAARLFRLAADQGYTDAECMLGIAYADGCGVPRSSTEATRYFKRAVAKGHAPAKDAMKRMQLFTDHFAGGGDAGAWVAKMNRGEIDRVYNS